MENKTEAQKIRELGDRLMKIHEGDMDDYGLGDHGRELDRDEPAYNPDAKGDKFSLVDQLAKAIDSRGNPNPIDTVTTRDGSEIKITMDQAANLMKLLKREPANFTDREEKDEFRKEIETKVGLVPFLDMTDGQSMQNLYVKKYMSDTTKMAIQNKRRGMPEWLRI